MTELALSRVVVSGDFFYGLCVTQNSHYHSDSLKMSLIMFYFNIVDYTMFFLSLSTWIPLCWASGRGKGSLKKKPLFCDICQTSSDQPPHMKKKHQLFIIKNHFPRGLKMCPPTRGEGKGVWPETRDRPHILIKHQKAERVQTSLSSCKDFWRVLFPYWLQISSVGWHTKLCLQQLIFNLPPRRQKGWKNTLLQMLCIWHVSASDFWKNLTYRHIDIEWI